MAGSDRARAHRRAAIDKGIEWLASRQQQGRWASFRTLAGISDVWVTGFVGKHLQVMRPRMAGLAAARRFLRARQQADGGWGFGGDVPADADSTAWCLSLLLLPTRAFPVRARKRAEAFLARQETPQGMATYSADSGIREFIRADGHQSIAGWTAAHADVTAAVLCVRPRNDRSIALLRALLARQSAAGLIESYWWRSPYYALVLALRALRNFRLRPSAGFVTLALENLDGKQLADGGYALGGGSSADAFCTSLALEAYCHLAHDIRGAKIARAAQALRNLQAADGSWPGDWVLRIPSPAIVDPRSVHQWSAGSGGGNALVRDEDGVFATTLACHALHLHEQRLAARYTGLKPDWPRIEPLESEAPDNVAVVTPIRPPEIEHCGMRAPAGSR